MAGNEFLLGYTPDGVCEIVMRPVRGPVTAFRVRSPPPQPPCGPRSPSPPPTSPRTTAARNILIPTSDGSYMTGNISVFSSLKITMDTNTGRRTVKEESPRPIRVPPPRTPPSAAAGAPTRPPPSQQRWMSPPRVVPTPQDPPPPYQGIEVREVAQRARNPPPAYGEVIISQDEDAVQMIARTSQGLYPVIPATPPPAAQPSAPPLDQDNSRGTIRPHSLSPFVRNVKPCLGEDNDLEAVTCLLDFATRRERTTTTMVRTFSSNSTSSTPRTPAPALRPDRPPPIITRRLLASDIPRPRPLRSSPPSAALGAPPREDNEEMEEEELPDIPSPAVSDITVHSTVSSPNASRSESPWVYSGYSSDELEEYEYVDPFEGEGPFSTTPPPPCDRPDHEVCVPPAWGERIPGCPVLCVCCVTRILNTTQCAASSA